jgi:hypothetical protein
MLLHHDTIRDTGHKLLIDPIATMSEPIPRRNASIRILGNSTIMANKIRRLEWFHPAPFDMQGLRGSRRSRTLILALESFSWEQVNRREGRADWELSTCYSEVFVTEISVSNETVKISFFFIYEEFFE